MAKRTAATRTGYNEGHLSRRFIFTGTYETCLAADIIPLERGDGAKSARILSVRVTTAAAATTVTPALYDAESSGAAVAANLTGGLTWGSTTPGLVFVAPTEAQGSIVSLDADGILYLKPTPDATATVIIQVIAEREA